MEIIKTSLVHLPDGGSVALDLSKSPGTLAVEWIDADRGHSTPAGEVEGGSVRSFKAPFDGDGVFYLRGRKQSAGWRAGPLRRPSSFR
jgi:hypothetical protein